MIAAPRELLADGGVDALTMRALARRLEVAPNAVYSHVASKSALLDDVLDAGDGTDSVSLFETVLGSAYGDVVVGSTAVNTLSGRAGADDLRGSSGNDRLYGQGGADRLAGGTGADALSGGLQRDTCAGGTGRDTSSSCERRAGIP